MTTLNSNLRKAAVFIRSLDAETAAKMLAHLSADEAAALRDAVREVGPLDPEEQADVVAEFRSARPIAAESAGAGVELSLSATSDAVVPAALAVTASAAAGPVPTSAKRFEFLEQAPIDALVPYLAREHVQTIAVVLSHLAPPRAAAVVAALPEKLQAETLERLAALGETDPDSVVVVERELASWLARRKSGRSRDVGHNETVAAILASTDALTRSQILANLRRSNFKTVAEAASFSNTAEIARADQAEQGLKTDFRQKSKLADELGQADKSQPQCDSIGRQPRSTEISQFSHQAAACAKRIAAGVANSVPQRAPQNPLPVRRPAAPAPIQRGPIPIPPFDDLLQLDARTLACVLREVDMQVLVLALAGSQEKLAEKICDQLPKRMTRVVRRNLRELGPTRLSDVEAAQRALSRLAAKHLAAHQTAPLAAAIA
jgi:flagellar motor switch protein FliG